jgi:hypothetical protein
MPMAIAEAMPATHEPITQDTAPPAAPVAMSISEAMPTAHEPPPEHDKPV